MSCAERATSQRVAPPVPRSRMQVTATWLFVLPLLTEGVLPDVVKLQLAGLAVLAFARLISRQPLPHHAIERALAVLGVLSLVVLGYLALGSRPAFTGRPGPMTSTPRCS